MALTPGKIPGLSSIMQKVESSLGGRALGVKIGAKGKVAGRLGAVVAGEAAKKAAGALGGLLSAGGRLVDAAFQPGATNSKQTVPSSFGMVGTAARAGVSGGGTMPVIRPTVTRVSSNQTPQQLLSLAVNYLSSIDATLKAQLDQQRYMARQSALGEREKAIETPSTSLFQRVGGVASSVTQSSTFNKLMKLALLGVAAAAYENLDKIDDVARGVVEFAQQAADSLSGAINIVGGVAAALGIGGIIAAIKKGGLGAAKGLLKGNALAIGASLGLDILFSDGKLDGRKLTEYISGAIGATLAGIGAGMFTGGLGTFVAGSAGYMGASKLGGALYDKIVGPSPSATPQLSKPDELAEPSNVPDTAYDVVLGYGKFGRPEDYYGKKLTELTVAEAIEFGQKVLIPNGLQDANIRARTGGRGDSGMGAYSFNQTTLRGLVDLGAISMSDKFDAATQDKAAKYLFNMRKKQGSLSSTWAVFEKRGEAFGAGMSFEQAKPYIMAGEGTAGRLNDMSTVGSRVQVSTQAAVDNIKRIFAKVRPTNIARGELPIPRGKTMYNQQIRESAMAYEKLLRMKPREAANTPPARQAARRATQRNKSAVMSVPNPNYGQMDMLDYATYFRV